MDIVNIEEENWNVQKCIEGEICKLENVLY